MIKYKVKNNKLLKRKCKQIYLLPKIEEKNDPLGFLIQLLYWHSGKVSEYKFITPYLLITFYLYFLIITLIGTKVIYYFLSFNES